MKFLHAQKDLKEFWIVVSAKEEKNNEYGNTGDGGGNSKNSG